MAPESISSTARRRRPMEVLRQVGLQRGLALGLASLLVAYFALVPLLYLLWGTFFGDGGATLDFFRDAYSEQRLGEMLGNTFQFALFSTIIAVTLGTLLAYLVVRTDIPMRGLVFGSALVPLIIPGILHTISWIFLASPRVGIINTFLEPVVGPEFFDVFSMGGMSFVQGIHLAPLVFLLMYAGFRAMDPSLEESALMSGASRLTIVRRITLPLVRPALYASILIMLVRGFEAFEVPALLGIPRGRWVLTSRIWAALNEFPANFGKAGAYATTLLVLTSAGLFFYTRLNNRAKRFQTITGKAFRPRAMPLGRWKWPLTGFVLVYFALSVVLPMAVLIYTSTQKFYTPPSIDALQNMTLRNYELVFTRSDSLRAVSHSILLAVGTATVVMLVMSVVSWIVVRTRLPGRWMLDNMSFVPLMIPGLVLGVALLFVYLRSPVPIFGSLWILFIAYFTRYMPYGMRYASSSMYQISAELEESAQTSGASWSQTFRRIILPLLVPGFVAGWIYIAIVSMRELSSSLLLYSPGTEVMSVQIWELWEDGQTTRLAALGVVMILILVVLVAIARRLGAQVGVRDN